MKPVHYFFLLMIFLPVCLYAQRFGGNKPSVQWQQVNTPASRVIFPKGLDTTAMRVSAVVQQLSNATLGTIGRHKNKIDIVLQPQTTISNAYVSLGPFRSEFYLTPPQSSFDLGSLPWADNLAIHEYRHVQQYNNFDVGLSAVFRTIFGQQGQELANSLAIPNWFWEGDAVFQETLVSKQGRGRLPSFFDDYRSLWLAGRNYSWMKLRNGSLRDFTPDHYRLGYMMVAYGREKYGDDFWKNVTHDAAAFKGLFYPFQKAVKQYSGKNFTEFRKDALNYFKQQSASADTAKVPKHFVGDQQFAAWVDDGTFIYVKDSYKDIPTFIRRKGDAEKKIRAMDVTLDKQFSYRNGRIVYASSRPDTRWSWNDYNEIQVLNAITGDQTTITHHTRYFSPDINESGEKIIAVDVQPGGKSHLHLLDASSGAVLNELPNKENLFFTYPKFVNDQQVVTTARKPTGEMALVLVNLNDGSNEYLTLPSFRVMGFPTVQHDTVYFSAAGDQYDELYAVSLNDKKMYRLYAVTNGIGAYQPAVHNDKIITSTFTAYGYRLQQINKKDLHWNLVNSDAWTKPDHSFGIKFNSGGAGLLATVPNQSTTVSKYPKAFHLFNFHSLRPYIDDPNYTASVVGENVLNTLQSELFFTYNRNEQYKQFGFNTTYGGWFPYITAGTNYTIDRRGLFHNKTIFWNEWESFGGLQVPLNFSKGRMFTDLTFGSNYTYNQSYFQGVYKDSIRNTAYSYLNNFISFTNQMQQARQHIYPHFAQSVFLNLKTAVQQYKATQFLASGNLYFPGFSKTHSIVIGLALGARDSMNQVRFSNDFPFSRGYTAENFYRMYKWNANYHLPLLYPDWGVGNLVYFLRVRANAFYDFTRVQDFYTNRSIFQADFRSAGAEIFFDTKWWNNLPVNFGFRYSHLLDPDLFGGRSPDWFEFILPVNLLQR